MRWVKRCTRSGPAARRVESTTSSPRSKRAPCPSVSTHAAHPREQLTHGHRRVVALRDPAELEHVRRAVRAGVGAVGAELNVAAGLVDVQPVARPEPDELLLRVPGQDEPDPVARPRAR